jgi:hypothetical protein
MQIAQAQLPEVGLTFDWIRSETLLVLLEASKSESRKDRHDIFTTRKQSCQLLSLRL